ncbi:MAG: leucine-rich repeat protein, partial [Clostridia bacterium]|nr:leucine-rich repeat protein [Clostridia bacterium]
MKRFLSLFLAFIFVIGVFFSTPVIVSAEGDVTTPEVVDPYEGVTDTEFSTEGFIRSGNWIYIKVSDEPATVRIKEYVGTEVDSVPISEATITVDGTPYNVTGIEANAFDTCTQLTQLTIPTFITIINKKAFDDSSLTSITYEGHLGAWKSAFTGDLGEIALSTTVCQDATISCVGNENTIIATCSCGVVCGTLTLEAIDDIIYNGNSYEVSVKDAGTVPGYTEDMKPSYSVKVGIDENENVVWEPLENNELPTDVGEYKATFELKVDEEVKASAKANFTITQKPITEENVTLTNPAVIYTGSAQLPEITVKDGGKTLNTGTTDYTVKYKAAVDAQEYIENPDFINVGTIFVEVAGINNYKDTVIREYVINKAPLTITAKTESIIKNNLSLTVEDVESVGLQGSDVLSGITITTNPETDGKTVDVFQLTP